MSVEDVYSMGWTEVRLARVSADPAERSRRYQAARELWSSIDRQDLIETYLPDGSAKESDQT
jgi:hypothetical protein